ncbi:MAG: sensor histidine kinase, partial [Gammaproteobacteria bacterium]
PDEPKATSDRRGSSLTQSDLSELSHRVLVAQEEARKRIASELHDGVGQSLTVIKYLVEDFMVASKSPDPEQPDAERDVTALEYVVRKIQDTIEEVRRTALNLRPVMLDDLGLLYTMEWLRREIEIACPGLAICSEISISEDEVPENLRLVVFRLVQEGLNNVARHARASCASVKLERRDGCLRLEISDNGRGFQVPEQMDNMPGLGLVNMHQRAALSGGELSIDSGQNSGTSLIATWRF